MMLLSRAALVVWLSIAIFGGDLQDGRERATCPAPTVRTGGVCVLSRDTILDQPLQLADSTTLDCRGHGLRVRRPGIPCDLGGACSEYRASVPEVAVYVNAARGVTVRNCTTHRESAGAVRGSAGP